MSLPSEPNSVARIMWTLTEPLHAVLYFAPDARAAFEQAGLRGGWRAYFAGRAAPLGAVGPAPVTAMFYGFAPAMVARALPQVWEMADPASVLAARRQGAHTALTRLLGANPPGVERAAQLCRRAALAAGTQGRPLAAANAALPWPQEDPLDVLWHAATILREHRGDGHVAALLVAGLDGCESIVWRSAFDNERAVLQPMRGWSDEQWEQAAGRLAGRGWLDAQGRPTDAGRERIARIEATTDALAAGPWQALGEDVRELPGLLRPLAAAAFAVMPSPNPLNLPPPDTGT
ncbi:MAG TPA: hypothetical protein VGM10_15295 [Actinocrinis sp.]